MLKVLGFSSRSAYLFSGFLSSTPPWRLFTTSDSMFPNLVAPSRNSAVSDSALFPQSCCSLKIGRKTSVRTVLSVSSMPPWISPHDTSCSTDFSATPLALLRMKYTALLSKPSTSPVVRKRRFSPEEGSPEPSSCGDW